MTLVEARAWLDSASPLLYPALVVAVIWLTQWAVRKWQPGIWEAIANIPVYEKITLGEQLNLFDRAVRKAWQALPSILSGAVLMWLAGGGNLPAMLIGAVAPALHELLKASPLPYGNKRVS